VLAISGLVASMGAANAVVTGGGGSNAQGTPTFYKDAQGVALELCLDGTADVQCTPPDADHVGSYFEAEATLGPWRMIYAIEAINDPVDGLMVINGARFRANIPGNKTYTIKDPWGTTKCRAQNGVADCRHETAGGFNAVSNGHITTFLHAVSRRGSAFIGAHPLVSRVFGSPTGFNKIRITGGGRTWTTSDFSVMGQKRADTAMSAINKRSLDLGNGRKADAITRSVRYTSFGTAAARPTIRKDGLNPGAFSVRDTCAAQAPGSACSITVKFVPRQNANSVKRAFLVIDDNGLAAPRRVSLKGVGLRR
jgi:hypothetical protein